jgi:hypothetical protein
MDKEPSKYVARHTYTDAFVLKCTSNRPEGHPSLLLLTALRSMQLSPRVVDDVFSVEADSTKAYLLSGVSNEGIDDTKALEVFDKLYLLVEHNAYQKGVLNVAGVIKAMRA